MDWWEDQLMIFFNANMAARNRVYNSLCLRIH